MIKKIFKTIYYLILAVIAVIVLILVLSVFSVGGMKTLIVLSGSMEPEIKTGSVVLVKPAAEYKVGDIITFKGNEKTKTPTTHRINEIKDVGGQKAYETKGDANNAPDQKTISEKEIIGKLVFGVPLVGYAVAAAQKPVGFLVIVIIPVVIIIYDEAQNIKKEIMKKIDYKNRIKKREEEKQETGENNNN
ncbi:MAG TPA: signal peptidase I [Candidatus Moranbacteria bacterium]|nr:signal peptidase I [Candidatus Moranbacteria bacterium]